MTFKLAVFCAGFVGSAGAKVTRHNHRTAIAVDAAGGTSFVDAGGARNRHGANHSTGEDSHCQGSPAASDRVNRCKQPGHYRWDQLLCDDCGAFWTDTHPHCAIPCCDHRRNIPHDMCECTPRTQKFVIDWGQNHVVGKNTAEKCCGRDQYGHPAISHQDSEACGCGHVGTPTNYGGHGSDCCSGECDSNNWCIARACAKKGEAGKCCRTTRDLTHPYDLPHTGSCGCFHAGDVPNPNDIVDYQNCCSGKASPVGGCACIDDENFVLPDGTLPTDCCSGKLTDDNMHCKAAECTEVGGTLETAGDYCCSGKTEEGDEKKCTCVPSGEKPGAEATNRDCCSLKLEGGVCQFLFKGDPLPNNTDARNVCNSGQKDRENRCRCVNKGAESEHESDCCSGAYLNPEKKGNMCGCVPVDGALEYGAGKGNCCTKTAVEGICRCAVPGSPVLPMMKADQDCCAKDTPSGSAFCGCVGPDTQQDISHEDSHVCCGGSQNYDGHGCSCVEDGVGVGVWQQEQACCSGKINETDAGRACSVCDMQCYLDRYEDLQKLFGPLVTGNTNDGEAQTGLNTGEEAQKHWNAKGLAEGRDCTCR